MPQDTRIHTPMVYSRKLTLDQIINMPIGEMYRQAKEGERTWFVEDTVKCLDGTTMSVQASSGHYCAPRGNYPPFYEVEVGCLTGEPGVLAPYENGGIYAYVPVEVVQEYINQHGGEVVPS